MFSVEDFIDAKAVSTNYRYTKVIFPEYETVYRDGPLDLSVPILEARVPAEAAIVSPLVKQHYDALQTSAQARAAMEMLGLPEEERALLHEDASLLSLRANLTILGGGSIETGYINDSIDGPHSVLVFLLHLAEQVNIMTTPYGEATQGYLWVGAIMICHELGLPIYQKSQETDIAYPLTGVQTIGKSLGFDALLKDKPFFGFTMFDLWMQIQTLYMLYLIYRYLQYDDDEAKSMLEGSYEFVYITDKGRSFDQAINMYLDDVCVLAPFKRVISVTNGKITEELACEALMDVARHQLLDKIAYGETGMCISTCSSCGSRFVKKHGNAKLCAECKLNKEKIKRTRAKKKAEKEAQANAEKEGKQ